MNNSKTKDVMTADPATCRTSDTLEQAAHIMWDRDCGFVPVVDDSGALAGVLSDRDICMAAYTRGQALGAIDVGSVMNEAVATCSPQDDLQAVHELMRRREVRRIPVVDGGRPVGVVSLNDLALAAEVDREARAEVARTLAAVCRHRTVEA